MSGQSKRLPLIAWLLLLSPTALGQDRGVAYAVPAANVAVAADAEAGTREWAKTLAPAFQTSEKINVLIQFRTVSGAPTITRERAARANGAESASAEQVIAQARGAIEGPARAMSESLKADGVAVQWASTFHPLLLANVTRADIEKLSTRTDVEAVYLNERLKLPRQEGTKSSGNEEAETAASGERERAALLNSTIRIGADRAWQGGFRGQSQTVAVLDDGIYAAHEMFGNKIVNEACFSNGPLRIDEESLCPGSLTTVTGVAGAASRCPNASTTSFGVCDHGSHVSAIAVGNNALRKTATAILRQGVAPDAKLIAVQVFTRDRGCYLDTCLFTYPSDILRAIDWLISIYPTTRFSAINLSLGGGQFLSNCPTDARASGIRTLRALGVLTVIASGNDGFVGGISAPACIGDSIAVGSVDSANRPSLFSNNSRLLDLFAPGEQIRSAVFSSTISAYASFDGTSMAAPHVAGAVATLKSRFPNASSDEIEYILKASGTRIGDGNWTWTTPSINLGEAVEMTDTTPPPRGLAIAGFFPGLNPSTQSYLRLFSPIGGNAGQNTGPSQNVVLTIVQDKPRRVLGVYGASLAPKSGLVLAMADIEAAISQAAAPTSKVTIYAAPPLFPVYLQHIALNTASNTMTNLTRCYGADAREVDFQLANMQTKTVANFPSYLSIYNRSGLPKPAIVDIHNGRSGSYIGLLGTVTIEPGENLVLPVDVMLNALGVDPGTTLPYVNILPRNTTGTFSFSHLTQNIETGALVDMSLACLAYP